MTGPPASSWADRLLATHPRQPDQRSCGASVLVMERALRDHDYARWLVENTSRFASESLSTHARTTGAVTAAGRLQLPWPRALGTPPWAVAGDLSASTGLPYQYRTALRREPAWETLVGPVAAGTPCPLYVGSRWVPRHVVLTVRADDNALQCYEPGSGRVLSVTRAGFLDASFRLAGWTKPWFVVTPR